VDPGIPLRKGEWVAPQQGRARRQGDPWTPQKRGPFVLRLINAVLPIYRGRKRRLLHRQEREVGGPPGNCKRKIKNVGGPTSKTKLKGRRRLSHGGEDFRKKKNRGPRFESKRGQVQEEENIVVKPEMTKNHLIPSEVIGNRKRGLGRRKKKTRKSRARREESCCRATKAAHCQFLIEERENF